MRTTEDFRALLENSFEQSRGCFDEPEMSHLEWLGDYVFGFTTYDDEVSKEFAKQAVEVCRAITDGKTFDYIRDRCRYRWYLMLCNLPFFAPRLNWGMSIRGAWWDEPQPPLDSCGIFEGEEQVTSLEFDGGEWPQFIQAVVDFGEAVRGGGDG